MKKIATGAAALLLTAIVTVVLFLRHPLGEKL